MTNPDKLFGRLGNRMFQMAYIYAEMKRGFIPDFYVQDFNYFKDCEKEIKDLFGEGIGFLDFVSIHVRVGANPSNPDEPKYINNPFYVNLLTTDYYEKAIAMFPNEKFLVFSDDPEYVKTLDLFKGERFQILDKEDEISDMNLQSSCKHNIIANSSFSFWCGYLNPNPAKTVVAPSKWFSDGISRVKIPSEWKLI